MIGLGVVAVALGVKCTDRYPLESIPGTCAPCVCSSAGILEGCPYHAELMDPVLWISYRNVAGVNQDAFVGNEMAVSEGLRAYYTPDSHLIPLIRFSSPSH